MITNDFPPNPGGIENYVFSLVRRWPAGEVVVVTRAMPGSAEFDSGLDFEVIREPVDTLLPKPQLARRMVALAADRGVDVVHFPSALPLGLMGAGLGVPYAVSVHGGEFLLASRLPASRSLLKSVCRRAAVMLPESSFAESLVARLVGPSTPMERVTCGVDADRYAPGAAEPVDLGLDGPVVVSVSRLVARKGPRTLVKAMPRVLASRPDAHLLIVGGGPDFDHVSGMVAAAGLGGSVTMAGAQPWDRIPSFLAAARIFALPTRARFFGTETEGLPLVYVEGAAAGLPLIGGDAGGVRDAVRPGQTGILVDGSKPEQTSRAILQLLDDPEEAARLGAAGREMVLKEFTWDAVFGTYRRALKACVG
ncbi:MAG TPA: glycosyltransferase family 4 protein [Actinomycetota bacterium]|nr:glycosyltransferase family 4 protein [Actinomycetota bacterium]